MLRDLSSSMPAAALWVWSSPTLLAPVRNGASFTMADTSGLPSRTRNLSIELPMFSCPISGLLVDIVYSGITLSPWASSSFITGNSRL